MRAWPTAPRRLTGSLAVRADDRLHEGRELERAGCVAEAMQAYRSACAEAEPTGQWAVQAQALRRLAVLHHRRGEAEPARTLCEQSLAIALAHGDDALAAEALNVQGGMANERGELERAHDLLRRGLELAAAHPGLVARLRQNLGINANIRGRFDEALEHYTGSFEAWERAGDDHGRAIAFHNLGKIHADRQLWGEADRYFEESRAIAERIGDLELKGLCLLNHSEVHIARQQFERARQSAEEALAIFDQLGGRLGKAEAYCMIGAVYRETGRLVLAESRLRAAVELARATGSLPCEAEASRELAILYQTMGRNQEALALLNVAHGLFRKIDAAADLVDVGGKMARLEQTYLAVVREWGQSLESADSYTFGHCERVANYAVAVARALDLPDHELTTVRLGAYLHDVGKIKVPHEILNKPGRLTEDEFEVVMMHPVWGVELLEQVEFPWDIKPIIRWHHEKYDGTGYPDRLRGEEIPLHAMIIGIVDVYDALTTTRSYRAALPAAEALAVMDDSRRAWRDDVYAAFRRAVAEPAASPAQESFAA